VTGQQDVQIGNEMRDYVLSTARSTIRRVPCLQLCFDHGNRAVRNARQRLRSFRQPGTSRASSHVKDTLMRVQAPSYEPGLQGGGACVPRVVHIPAPPTTESSPARETTGALEGVDSGQRKDHLARPPASTRTAGRRVQPDPLLPGSSMKAMT